MTEDQIGDQIIKAALKVHTVLGPGLLESAYQSCMAYELEKQALPVRREVVLPVRYEEITIDNGYRIDLLVGGLVVVELKALETILPVHRAQLLSYLRLGAFKLGYLLNFHVLHTKDGISRIVNNLQSSAYPANPRRPRR